MVTASWLLRGWCVDSFRLIPSLIAPTLCWSGSLCCSFLPRATTQLMLPGSVLSGLTLLLSTCSFPLTTLSIDIMVGSLGFWLCQASVLARLLQYWMVDLVYSGSFVSLWNFSRWTSTRLPAFLWIGVTVTQVEKRKQLAELLLLPQSRDVIYLVLQHLLPFIVFLMKLLYILYETCTQAFHFSGVLI